MVAENGETKQTNKQTNDETYNTMDDVEKAANGKMDDAHAVKEGPCGRRAPKKKMIVVGSLVFLVLGIALGVGLAVGGGGEDGIGAEAKESDRSVFDDDVDEGTNPISPTPVPTVSPTLTRAPSKCARIS